jgi:hypothetical protein
MRNAPLCIAAMLLFACGTSGSKPLPPSPTPPPSPPADARTTDDDGIAPDPVSCRSVDDCWAEEMPVPHAIARPPALEGRTFRGCVDGEHVPRCVEGRCTLQALKC